MQRVAQYYLVYFNKLTAMKKSKSHLSISQERVFTLGPDKRTAIS